MMKSARKDKLAGLMAIQDFHRIYTIKLYILREQDTRLWSLEEFSIFLLVLIQKVELTICTSFIRRPSNGTRFFKQLVTPK